MRAPLCSISQIAKMIIKDNLIETKAGKDLIATINVAASLLSYMVNDLLDRTLIRTGAFVENI